jgi:Sperm-tail PG-rich repeat
MSTAFSMLDQAPGPGAYAVGDAFKKYKEGKGVTMGSRYEEPQKKNVPGPGTYPKQSSVDQAFKDKKGMSFGKHERDNPMIVKDQLMTPIAGAYVIKGAT